MKIYKETYHNLICFIFGHKKKYFTNKKNGCIGYSIKCDRCKRDMFEEIK
jgi:hypothetical protein